MFYPWEVYCTENDLLSPTAPWLWIPAQSLAWKPIPFTGVCSRTQSWEKKATKQCSCSHEDFCFNKCVWHMLLILSVETSHALIPPAWVKTLWRAAWTGAVLPASCPQMLCNSSCTSVTISSPTSIFCKVSRALHMYMGYKGALC